MSDLAAAALVLSIRTLRLYRFIVCSCLGKELRVEGIRLLCRVSLTVSFGTEGWSILHPATDLAPFPPVFATVLGRQGFDQDGVCGLERYKTETLHRPIV